MQQAERQARRTHRRLWAAALLCALGVPTAAAAQYGASASTSRPIAARNQEDATAAGISIDLEHREIPLERMVEVMREVPGARPVTGGGYGAFSSVSLRGSQLGHTVFVLGEVPLNTPDSGAFDMSTLPLPLLSSMEVYRGGAPAWYSQGAIGGVVRLVPDEAEGTGVGAAVGAGSFGRYEGRVHSQVITPKLKLRTGLGLSHAENDYPHAVDAHDSYSEGGERRFRNGNVTDGSGLIHLEADVGPGQLELVTLGFERAGGVPGPGEYNTKFAHRNYTSGLASLAYTQEKYDTREHRDYRVQLLASVRAEHNRFQDPRDEFGGADSPDRRAMWWRSTLRAAASYSPLDWLEGTLIGTFSNDRYDSQGVGKPVEPTSSRNAEAVVGELRFMGKLGDARAELRGSARLEVSQAELNYDNNGTKVTEDRTLIAPTYRAAAVVEAIPGLSIRSSFSTGVRIPSVLELFGDGGFIKGNARDLVPERGMSADLGVVLSGNTGKLAGTLEVGGFLQHIDDLIVWRRNSQFELVAENRGRARIPGLEIGLSGCLSRYFSLNGSATFLNAENPDTGTQIPRRPRVVVYMRPELSFFTELRALSRIGLFSTVDYQSTFFHDRANDALQPQRTLVGVGSALAGFEERIVFTFRAENVADVRTADLFMYPLPGRGFSALLTYQEEI